MKLNQLDSNADVFEAPQGIFKTAGLKAKSFLGRSDLAKGQLQTGGIANQLKKEYMTLVGRQAGKTGTTKPTSDTLIQFLASKGINSKEVASIIDKELQAEAPPAQEPANDQPPADAVKNKPVAQTSTDPNNPLKPGNNTANMKQASLDLDNPNSSQGDLFKNNPIPSMAPKKPAVKQPAGRTQGGGKVAGKLSQTPGAIAKRNARAKKPNSQLQLMSMYSEQSQRYRKNFEKINWDLKEDQEYFNALEFMGVMEAEISDKIVDKILMRYAVDMDEPNQAQAKDTQKTAPNDDPNTQKTAPDASAQAEPQQDTGDDADANTDTDTQKKGDGFLKGVGKALSGVTKKAVGGVTTGLGDNPETAQGSKIFDPDEQDKTVRGNLNYQNISKQFPGIDPTMLRRSMSKGLSGKGLTKVENETMAQAMIQLLKKDPQQTVKVMNLFKMTKEV